MARNGRQLLVPVLALVASTWVSAATVYKYVNPQGAVTYSDTPPADVPYEELELRDYPAVDGDARRAAVEEMIETTARLQADRQQREEERRAARPPPAARYQTPPAPEPEVYFYPGYRHPYYHQRPRPAPPYRLQPESKSPRDRITTPLRIPQFGTGESLREKMGH